MSSVDTRVGGADDRDVAPKTRLSQRPVTGNRVSTDPALQSGFVHPQDRPQVQVVHPRLRHRSTRGLAGLAVSGWGLVQTRRDWPPPANLSWRHADAVPAMRRRRRWAVATAGVCLLLCAAGCTAGPGPSTTHPAAPTTPTAPVVPADPQQNGPTTLVEGTVSWNAGNGLPGCPTLTTTTGFFTLIGPTAQTAQTRARTQHGPSVQHVVLRGFVWHKTDTYCEPYRMFYVDSIERVIDTNT